MLGALQDYPVHIPKILIPEAPEMAGYPGFDYLSHTFKEKINGPIKGIEQLDLQFLNTYTESQSLIEYLNKNSLQEISIIAPEFHQLRAFWSVVSYISKRKFPIKVYNYIGNPLPWDEKVIHNQGRLQGFRKDFVFSELERIILYKKKGNLVKLEEIYNYILWRDEIPDIMILF